MKWALVLLLLISGYAISCTHSSRKPVLRQTASHHESFKLKVPMEFLPIDEFACPVGTKLASGTVDVSVNDCLSHYTHREIKHGVTREQICFPSETRHERRLRIPPDGKNYASVMRNVYYPTAEAETYVVLNLNHAYYSIQMRHREQASDLSATTVRTLFRETPFPQKVKLERCECDVVQNGEGECLKRLQPLMQNLMTYSAEI